MLGLGVTTEVGADLLDELEGARAQVQRLTTGKPQLYQRYEALLWDVRLAIGRARAYLLDTPTRLKDITSFDREAKAAHARYFPLLKQAFADITGQPAVKIADATTAGNVLDELALMLKVKKTPEVAEEEPLAKDTAPPRSLIEILGGKPSKPTTISPPARTEPDTYTESLRNQPDPSAHLVAPEPGKKKQPLLSPDDVGNLVQSVFGAWTDIEQAKLKSALLKRQSAGQNIYLTPQAERKFAQSKMSFANIASLAVGTLLIGGLLFGVYLFYKGQK